MELPKELYIQLYIFANNVSTTKTLRSLCNTSFSASYDYFDILLKTKIPIYYTYYEDNWSLNKHKIYFCCDSYASQITSNPINKDISFNTTIKDLYKK